MSGDCVLAKCGMLDCGAVKCDLFHVREASFSIKMLREMRRIRQFHEL